ncbi:hypothetical protein QUF80_19510 [Desulfococcaceae bacterium HSG8]|nr:hypothetical protein [Desulfococcaceae bacterium HSG8]
MNFVRNLALLLIILTFMSCATIKKKLGMEEGAATTGTALNIIISEGKSGLTEKQGLYKVIKGMTGPTNTVILYDASASMNYETPVETKAGEEQTQKRYELAYGGLTKLAEIFDENDKIWLVVFGSKVPYELTKSKKSNQINCEKAFISHSDVVSVYGEKDGGYDYKEFMSAITYLESGDSYIGDTPIGYAILKALEFLESKPNSKIILITDGEETAPLLAEMISRRSGEEEKLRKKYTDYDAVTISASSALEKARGKGIYFTPILCGLKSVTKNRATSDTEVETTRSFYKKLAKESGSVPIEVSSAEGLASAFIDAEVINLTYDVYNYVPLPDVYKKIPLLPDQKVGTGNTGVPMKLDPGKYRIQVHTTPPVETNVTIEADKPNTYVLMTGDDGTFKLVPSK